MLGLEKHIVNTYNLLVVIFDAFGTLATAYGLAIIGSTMGQPSCTLCYGSCWVHIFRSQADVLTQVAYTYFYLDTADEPDYAHTTNIIGGLNGLNSAGAMAGCGLSAWAADRYDRKRTIRLGCLILIVGGALCAGAGDIFMFHVDRFVAGVGAGCLAVVVPVCNFYPIV